MTSGRTHGRSITIARPAASGYWAWMRISAIVFTVLFASACTPDVMPGSTGAGGSSAASSSAETSAESSSASTGGDCGAGQKMCAGMCVSNRVEMAEQNGVLWRDCDGNPANGCEVNSFEDPQNCGACDNSCVKQHVSNSCIAPGYCKQGPCDDGWLDCDDNFLTGCEVHPVDDPNNCGSCGFVCPELGHTITHCGGGECQPPTCKDGWHDCNHNSFDGCESTEMCD